MANCIKGNLQLAFWVDHSNPLGLLIGTRGKEEYVLVDEHAEGDEGHVEPVQEVLNRNIHVLLNVLLVVELKDALEKMFTSYKMTSKTATFAICQTTSLFSFFIVSRVLQNFRNASSSNSVESKERSCSKLRQKSS